MFWKLQSCFKPILVLPGDFTAEIEHELYGIDILFSCWLDVSKTVHWVIAIVVDFIAEHSI